MEAEPLALVREYFTPGAIRLLGVRLPPGMRVRRVRDVVSGEEYVGRVYDGLALVGWLRQESARRGVVAPGRGPVARPWVKLMRIEGPRKGVATYL